MISRHRTELHGIALAFIVMYCSERAHSALYQVVFQH